MLRWLGVLVVFVGLLVGAVYLGARQVSPPIVSIDAPTSAVGVTGTLVVTVTVPRGIVSHLDIQLEQNGRVLPLYALGQDGATVTHPDADHLRVERPLGTASVPGLVAGPARVTAVAGRQSFLRLHTAIANATRDITVSLTPPTLSVVSTAHYVAQGGSELVVYRVRPADATTRVVVGDREFPGWPASAAGVRDSDPSLHVALFSLGPDQPVSTPIALVAVDAAGNRSQVSFVDRVIPKSYRASRIPVDDAFFARTVPAILSHTPDLHAADGSSALDRFLLVNGDLRRRNAAQVAALTAHTGLARQWTGPLARLDRSQAEAGFADTRTYVYEGRTVDTQLHLGFDLASTAAAPVTAASGGRVVFADWLGIYGNCVIIDHGLGLASLYGHLSALEVKAGDTVAGGQRLGRSGTTGLAGGDHVHFTTLVSGWPVTPIEWWDAHWLQDRVERKLSEAGAR